MQMLLAFHRQGSKMSREKEKKKKTLQSLPPSKKETTSRQICSSNFLTWGPLSPELTRDVSLRIITSHLIDRLHLEHTC